MDRPARCQAVTSVYSKLEIVIFFSIDGWRFTNCVNLQGDEWKAMSGQAQKKLWRVKCRGEMIRGKGTRREAHSSKLISPSPFVSASRKVASISAATCSLESPEDDSIRVASSISCSSDFAIDPSLFLS